MAVASCGDIRTHEPFGTYHLAEPSPFPQLDQELEQVQAENKVLKSELLRGRQAVDDVLQRQAELQNRVEIMRETIENKRNHLRHINKT
eukprot:g12893.t1